MTGDEDEAQQIIAHRIVDGSVEVGLRRLLFDFELVSELGMLALNEFVSPSAVDCTVLRGGHEPSARLVRDARYRPLLERGDESVLRKFLGEVNVAHDPRETGDDLCRLDPPDRF